MQKPINLSGGDRPTGHFRNTPYVINSKRDFPRTLTPPFGV